MDPPINVFAAKLDDLSSSPDLMVKEKHLLQVAHWYPHVYCVVCAHASLTPAPTSPAK